MISGWRSQALRNEPVWLADVRSRCAQSPDLPRLRIQLTLPNGSITERVLPLPLWNTPEERDFCREYLVFHLYNLLSVLGGTSLRIEVPSGEPRLTELLREVPALFQPGRRFQKPAAVASRINRALGAPPLQIEITETLPPTPAEQIPPSRVPLQNRLLAAAERAMHGLLCGVDIGGSDIKLVLVRDGVLLDIREYDWNPALSPTAEGILDPIRQLISSSLEKFTPGQLLSGLGISFPDVVVSNRIVGGETPKTRSIRQHAEDYEAEFRKITELSACLAPLCVPDAPIRITNDGHMAAFTAAMEFVSSHPDADLRSGIAAHTLGTDLGTGWLEPDGTIPDLPMEVYAILPDLGSRISRQFPSGDLRSTRNENSGLPDLRRLVGQGAAFRLAAEREPALLDGFTCRNGNLLTIRSDPDLRKPCLDHLMEQSHKNPAAAWIFREIGRNAGQVCRELQWICPSFPSVRSLFGRMVRDAEVFHLLKEGWAETAPDIRLIPAADSACSPLMRALSRKPGVPVAQFAQSVGAVCFSCF